MISKTDEELVRYCLKGHNEAKRELYLRYFDRCIQFAHAAIRKHFGNHGFDFLVEDLAHDILIKIFKNLGKYQESIAKFSTWFWTVASNTFRTRAMDIVRLKNKTAEDLPEKPDDENTGLSLLERIAVFDEDKDEFAEKEIRLLILDTIFSLKKEEVRTIFTMRFLCGMKYEEIAFILRIPEGTVKSYIFRGAKEFNAVFLKEISSMKLALSDVENFLKKGIGLNLGHKDISILKGREKKIMELRLLENMDLKEISGEMKLSAGEVRKMAKSAITKIIGKGLPGKRYPGTAEKNEDTAEKLVSSAISKIHLLKLRAMPKTSDWDAFRESVWLEIVTGVRK